MGKRIAGVCYLKVDGTQYSLAGSFDVQPMTKKLEKLVGLSGIAGHKEMPIVPYLDGEIFLTAETELLAFQEMTDVTATAELANGRRYVLRNACWAGDTVAKGADGTTTIRFEGEDCQEDIG